MITNVITHKVTNETKILNAFIAKLFMHFLGNEKLVNIYTIQEKYLGILTSLNNIYIWEYEDIERLFTYLVTDAQFLYNIAIFSKYDNCIKNKYGSNKRDYLKSVFHITDLYNLIVTINNDIKERLHKEKQVNLKEIRAYFNKRYSNYYIVKYTLSDDKSKIAIFMINKLTYLGLNCYNKEQKETILIKIFDTQEFWYQLYNLNFEQEMKCLSITTLASIDTLKDTLKINYDKYRIFYENIFNIKNKLLLKYCTPIVNLDLKLLREGEYKLTEDGLFIYKIKTTSAKEKIMFDKVLTEAQIKFISESNLFIWRTKDLILTSAFNEQIKRCSFILKRYNKFKTPYCLFIKTRLGIKIDNIPQSPLKNIIESFNPLCNISQ